ncbi:hypothetical protein PIB30_049336 [Stylosanthes scabra]|uniref:CCHC-type domain-containing protein n=1 Tax=Stylosanthes scabra TaxID=79078 RepID=A0ABU6YIG4_9FABA|nr:hypothetical protein [Stylosanthes scabra]
MPCVHAIAAICKLRIKPVKKFVSLFLIMDAIRATYDIHINPVNSEEFWHPTDGPKPIAPRIFRPPGRPRKKRTEAAALPPPAVNGDKFRRTFQVTYNKCGERGHYYKTCKGAPQLRDWLPKKKKPKTNMAAPSVEQTAPAANVMPVSQSAPTNANGNDSQPQVSPKFTIPVPPPMPKFLQRLRPKQKIFRPPAPFREVQFSTNHAQPSSVPLSTPIPHQQPLVPQQQPPRPMQQQPNPQQQPQIPPIPSNPNALSQETMAAARGTTSERIFNFMPTPNFKPPGSK